MLVSAMAPPGGGRNELSSRFIRHFNIVSIESFDDDLMRSIFQPIVNSYFDKSGFMTDYAKYSTVRICDNSYNNQKSMI